MGYLIPNAKPWITPLEKQYVNDALDSGWLTSHGKFHKELEEELAEFIGVKHVALLSNGSVACFTLMSYLKKLHLNLTDCIVYVPDLTYVATLNGVISAGLTPILVDVDKETWNIDSELLSNRLFYTNEYMFAVDLYGNPCNLDNPNFHLHNDSIFYDSAECFGGKYISEAGKKVSVGALGAAATFSGYANKSITLSGEGGWISTNNEDIYQFTKDFGGVYQKGEQYHHVDVGWNFRLTNVQAAFGLAQLRRFGQIQAEKERVFGRYVEGFMNSHIGVQKVADNAHHSKWVFACLVKNKKKVQDLLNLGGIETRPFFKPLHTLPFTRGIQLITNAHTPFSSVSQKLYEHGLVLPSYSELRNEQIDLVVKIVLEADK
jgi:perosamine synthetase